MSKTKETSITIDVQLDENKVPEQIVWSAPDGGIKKEEAQALLMSLWDGKNQETLRMDLWVKDMPIDQMNAFFHQSLVTMAQTFYRATQNEKMTATMNDFCEYFATHLNIDRGSNAGN